MDSITILMCWIKQNGPKVVGEYNLVVVDLGQSVDSLVESLHQDLEYLWRQ